MNRRRADTVVGVVVGFVLLVGGAFSWQAYRQRRAIEQSMGSMMDSSMGTIHGPDPLWPVLGTLLVAGGIGGVYYVIRGELGDSDGTDAADHTTPDQPSAETTLSVDSDDSQTGSRTPESNPRARVLDLLPDDERRVLEPVLNSPGITQIELRDRSEFSKSKVSQTVSALEERGLLYRERQGRTYRVYPSDDLRHQRSGG